MLALVLQAVAHCPSKFPAADVTPLAVATRFAVVAVPTSVVATPASVVPALPVEFPSSIDPPHGAVCSVLHGVALAPLVASSVIHLVANEMEGAPDHACIPTPYPYGGHNLAHSQYWRTGYADTENRQARASIELQDVALLFAVAGCSWVQLA